MTRGGEAQRTTTRPLSCTLAQNLPLKMASSDSNVIADLIDAGFTEQEAKDALDLSTNEDKNYEMLLIVNEILKMRCVHDLGNVYAHIHILNRISIRNKAVKVLLKIFENILHHSTEIDKYGNLNLVKMEKKFEQCRCAMDLLVAVGFGKSNDGTRFIWVYNDENMRLLKSAYNELKTSVNEEHKIHLINPSIFQSNSMKCNSSNNKNDIICNCYALQRASEALKYFDILCRDENVSKENKDKFVRFCEDVYAHQFIDDYAHIIQSHGQQIKEIQKEMISGYGLKECTLSGCTLYRRHRRRERNEEVKDNDDDEMDLRVAFWLEQYDKFHHFFFHLFQTGKRIEMALSENELAKYQQYVYGNDQLMLQMQSDEQEEKENHDDDSVFDKVFAQKQDALNEKKKAMDAELGGDDENEINKEKFNIAVKEKEATQNDMTTMDELYECIKEEEQMQMLQLFVIENGFHTETIEMDVMGKENESVLFQYCQDKELMDTIKIFFKRKDGM